MRLRAATPGAPDLAHALAAVAPAAVLMPQALEGGGVHALSVAGLTAILAAAFARALGPSSLPDRWVPWIGSALIASIVSDAGAWAPLAAAAIAVSMALTARLRLQPVGWWALGALAVLPAAMPSLPAAPWSLWIPGPATPSWVGLATVSGAWAGLGAARAPSPARAGGFAVALLVAVAWAVGRQVEGADATASALAPSVAPIRLVVLTGAFAWTRPVERVDDLLSSAALSGAVAALVALGGPSLVGWILGPVAAAGFGWHLASQGRAPVLWRRVLGTALGLAGLLTIPPTPDTWPAAVGFAIAGAVAVVGLDPRGGASQVAA